MVAVEVSMTDESLNVAEAILGEQTVDELIFHHSHLCSVETHHDGMMVQWVVMHTGVH